MSLADNLLKEVKLAISKMSLRNNGSPPESTMTGLA